MGKHLDSASDRNRAALGVTGGRHSAASSCLLQLDGKGPIHLRSIEKDIGFRRQIKILAKAGAPSLAGSLAFTII